MGDLESFKKIFLNNDTVGRVNWKETEIPKLRERYCKWFSDLFRTSVDDSSVENKVKNQLKEIQKKGEVE